jgi:hypothetical protein
MTKRRSILALKRRKKIKVSILFSSFFRGTKKHDFRGY